MENRKKPTIIFNTMQTEEFSSAYPFINNHLVNSGDYVYSRNGDTREVIDFKTEICNPYRRCVGNNKRDINIFFLLAEALWIWAGRKDVAFLDLFNSRMKNYSDDGKVFHAPYGFRLRHQGLSSYENFPLTDSNKHSAYFNGIDQILENLKMLSEDSETRRAVMQIWDANLDLNQQTKDLPCNDLVMLKVRNGKLRTTISNRSNDLHWGLPTNVFQFSFVTEIMSQILGVTLGTQTHNSQSLHFYLDNPIAFAMNDEFVIGDGEFADLYDNHTEQRMKFNFTTEGIENRLAEVDYYVNAIIASLEGSNCPANFEQDLLSFDAHLFRIYQLLHMYLEYQSQKDKTDVNKIKMIKKIESTAWDRESSLYDFEVLAINFFSSKLKDQAYLEKYCYNF